MFKIRIDNQADLLDHHACYALGWFELSNNHRHLTVFKTRNCMVFLTLTNFIDHLAALKSKRVNTRWIGEDDGRVVELNRNKSILSIKHHEALLEVNFDAFSHTVIEETEQFLKESALINTAIIDAGAFCDLKAALLEAQPLF